LFYQQRYSGLFPFYFHLIRCRTLDLQILKQNTFRTSSKSWSMDAPPPSERKTCFSCSLEIASPFKKWEQLRLFRLSLLNSGFFGVNSKVLEKVTHDVYNEFGTLVNHQDDQRWEKVLTIANSVFMNNS